MQYFRKIRQLAKEQDGVTALEFALIAPVLLLMTMGTIEMGVIMLAQNVMESATFEASRTGKTGYVAAGQTQADTIRDVLDERAGTLLDSGKVTITSEAYSQFDVVGDPEPFIDANNNGKRDNGENYTDTNGNGQYDPDRGKAGNGTGSEVVVYTVTYPWQVSTPFFNEFVGNDGILLLSARAVVQNEPF